MSRPAQGRDASRTPMRPTQLTRAFAARRKLRSTSTSSRAWPSSCSSSLSGAPAASCLGNPSWCSTHRGLTAAPCLISIGSSASSAPESWSSRTRRRRGRRTEGFAPPTCICVCNMQIHYLGQHSVHTSGRLGAGDSAPHMAVQRMYGVESLRATRGWGSELKTFGEEGSVFCFDLFFHY